MYFCVFKSSTEKQFIDYLSNYAMLFIKIKSCKKYKEWSRHYFIKKCVQVLLRTITYQYYTYRLVSFILITYTLQDRKTLNSLKSLLGSLKVNDYYKRLICFLKHYSKRDVKLHNDKKVLAVYVKNKYQ